MSPELTSAPAPCADRPAVLVLGAPAMGQRIEEALLAAWSRMRVENASNPLQFTQSLRRGGWSLAIVAAGVDGQPDDNAIAQASQVCPVIAIGPAAHTREVVAAVRSGAADFIAEARLHELAAVAARLIREARPDAAPDSASAARVARRQETREAFVLLDADWTVSGWGPGLPEVLGQDVNELVGQPLEALFPVSEATTALLARMRGCGSGPVADAGWMLRRDGLHMWADTLCVEEGDGLQRRFRLSVRDATLELRASQFMRAQADSAAATAGARNLFLGSIAHELRAALAPISTSAILLERQAAEPARHERLVAIIRRNASSAARLLEDLLTFSTASENKLQLRVRDVDLHLLLAECTDVARQGCHDSGSHLVRRVFGDAAAGAAAM